jgi:HEAT repeat protein
VAFLRDHLRPSPPPAPHTARLIADLDDDDFNVREKATAELAKLGKSVEADLKKADGARPSPEARWRLERLLARLTDAFSEETARVRAVAVLETIGTDDARQALEELVKGPADERLTKEAKASLLRMKAP